MMKVLVIGLGSMGRRRVRLLKSEYPDFQIIGVDLSEPRRNQAKTECGIKVRSSLCEAIEEEHPSAAFVCTSPATHGPIVMECLENGINVFTEINLISNWYDAAVALAKARNLTLFLSSTFLYRREIEFVANAVKGKKVNYIYHSGQYLPDWHPWESYKDFFVSSKQTNACREILAIEFPWIVWAFGEIESLYVMKGKDSDLEINFSDNYMISIRHKNGNKGVFCQDILSRKGLRRLEVYSERMHLFWDGTPQSLFQYDIKNAKLVNVVLYDTVDHEAGYNDNIVENAYRAEVVEFFDVLAGKGVPRYSFTEDIKMLDMIDKIEDGFYG